MKLPVLSKMSSGFEVEKDNASLSMFPLLPSGFVSEITERMVAASDVHGSEDYHQDEALLRTIKLRTTGIETEFLVVLTVNKPGDMRPTVSIDEGLIRMVRDGKEILVKHHPERELSAKILDFRIRINKNLHKCKDASF